MPTIATKARSEKSATPDRFCDKILRGGNLSSIPKPHTRRYPRHGNPKQSDGKRTVDVHIYTWIMVDSNAEHYYVNIQEEGNPIWDRSEKSWRFAWDDHGHSISCHEIFYTLRDAVDFAKRFVKNNFNTLSHSIQLRYKGNTSKYTFDEFIEVKFAVIEEYRP